jgi:tol-pal system-associated acyl-CoA thioesterase
MKVYGEDTDSFGIVHHPNYLKFMERARCEWVMHLGYSLEDFLQKGILFVVHKAELEYKQPLKTYTPVQVFSKIIQAKPVRVIYEQVVMDAQDPQKKYCKGLITVVCVDKNIQPILFPKELIDI